MAYAEALATASLVIAFLSLVGAYIVATNSYRTAATRVLSEVKAVVPEAERLWRDLKTESGRARNLIKHAKKDGAMPVDDDDLVNVLANHPLAQGVMDRLGIDRAKLLSGDAEELQKLMALGKQQKGQDQTIEFL